MSSLSSKEESSKEDSSKEDSSTGCNPNPLVATPSAGTYGSALKGREPAILPAVNDLLTHPERMALQ
jgi:hypothetical protein